MKILIGTPIHICKDYAMERWMQNVATLQHECPADLLLVDNSPGMDYVERVKGYCAKYEITNYKIEHFDIDQKLIPDLRIEVAQEIIRQAVLAKNYDAWFSWECDQIIPPNALNEMVRIMKAGDFMTVVHNCWSRKTPTAFSTDMGCTLVKKDALKKNLFLPERNGSISFNLSDRYEEEYKDRVLKTGGNYIEVYGVIDPIYHLNNNEQ